ncbi:Com family DNA-binding transcriptional regulator [Stenotrophomonas maltophilia]|uniref:Com family DNA-binding transcriptional regulator n=1 Tax=Stenotrophomonas maltophilia TaxID=40324 RepID=UPI001F530304|nr:Com family DNA-binding transcriptional regulator [Stenotrophomonas maltophilia]MCI1140291.1 Com family DNA-binding transcriptional regulator [Stenotrophomonas maltophilia]HDX0800970.1 Com family DNA-binding transcriptional regulator [Stenotrophomonas maltophilia]HDX0814867.1 Com family DNA-binding transcriptional regulator [Stenotrophomonas maltophilia]HDX0825884.1 Com family DNA-binding transcriptional regulator [Stenotrophomonas maltophilia]HDX0841979.1 Com family DNA-binding transcriptio
MDARVNLRCGDCARLLAKAAGPHDLQMKCPRCGCLNHMKATSLSMDRRERHHEEGSTNEERTDPRRCADRPADPAGGELRRPHH